MKLYSSLDEIPPSPLPTSFTIGFFDGVHLGHQFLLRRLGPNSLVLTFPEHPILTLRPHQPAPTLLTPTFQKLSLFASFGINSTVLLPFTREFAALTYEEFLLSLLAKFPHLHLILGEGSLFGRRREGNAERVLAFAAAHPGFTAEYLPKQLLDGEPISSSRIRAKIAAGDLAGAATLVGRPHVF